MLELLKQIPDVVWAAILTAIFTLGGALGAVLLANRNSRAQQAAALRHDATQRDREREMSLRKEIYLPAAEAISRSQNLLTRLSDLNTSDQDLATEFSSVSSTIAKIQVVGTNDTVHAVTAYMHELGTAYLELILKRFKLIDRKNQIEILSKFVDKSLKEQDRYISLMKQLNMDGNVDQRVWKVISDNFEFEKEQLKKNTNEKQQLFKVQAKEHIQFVELCFDRFVEISKFIPPAIFSVRAELDLDIDKEAYMKMFNNNLEKGKHVFSSFLAEVTKLMND